MLKRGFVENLNINLLHSIKIFYKINVISKCFYQNLIMFRENVILNILIEEFLHCKLILCI